MNVRNKRVFVPGRSIHPSLIFLGKARSLTEQSTFQVPYSRLGSLPYPDIRLDLKILPGTNTLAYYNDM